jgi:hypothetical protein
VLEQPVRCGPRSFADTQREGLIVAMVIVLVNDNVTIMVGRAR